MSNDRRIQWLQDARFGLFVHWGLYSVLAGEWRGQRMDYIGEWIMSRFRIPRTEYETLAARFDPQQFNADEWVRLAKQAGMRYVVFTAKHHEGFAMYHSACDPYNIVDASPFGRDPLQELAAACQRHGLRLGLYYSQDLDWHEPHGGDPGPSFPSNFGMSWGNDWDYPDRAAKDYGSYFERKVKPQVRELLTGYGPIGLIWFDCPVTISPTQSQELFDLVRSLQPDCLVNTRIGNGLGDYGSLGDNQAPCAQVQGVWETPATLNDTWGYKSFDHNWKSARDTLGVLAGLASKNVNYLLNIGPQADGRFPRAAVKILGEIGDWMEVNGAAIHGTRQSPFAYDFDWGWITHRAATERDPAKLYLLFKHWPPSPFNINGLLSKVASAACQCIGPDRGEFLSFSQTVDMHAAVAPSLTIQVPDEHTADIIPVVTLELEGEAHTDERLMIQEGVISLPAGCGRVQAQSPHPPAVDATGILLDWLDNRDWIEWEFYAAEAGDYLVDIVTSAVHHSHPWQGAHVVRLAVERFTTEATLKADQPILSPETRCYAQAISHCGALHVTGAGLHKLALKALDIKPNDGVGLALVSVRLRPLTPVSNGFN